MASNNGHISDYTQPSRPPNIVITQIIDVPKAPLDPSLPPQAHSRGNFDFLKIATHNSNYKCTQGPPDPPSPPPPRKPIAETILNF